MDGQRKPCPIVENTCLKLGFGTGEVLVSASCDSIQMFPDPQYTYLRIFDNGVMRALFLDADVMAEISDFGIPTTLRESITQTEHESWVQYMGQLALEGLDQEIDDLLG